MSINRANFWLKEGINSIEIEKSFDRLIFEGYREGRGRVDSVVVDGLNLLQNAAVAMN